MSHYVPMPDDPEQFDARVESKFVSLRVLERISSRNYQKRNEMPLYLHGIPTAAAFRGHVFVIKVHDILVCGCEIQTICIAGDCKSKVEVFFTCRGSKDYFFFDSKDLSKETLQTAVWIVDEALAHPNRVKLVFVRAHNSGSSITCKQPIPWVPVADLNQVSIIPSIGDAAFDRSDIKKVGDLRGGINGRNRPFFSKDILAQCASDVKKFDEHQKLMENMLANIPQYFVANIHDIHVRTEAKNVATRTRIVPVT
ncbi:hypothetical protein JG687_00011313 [Phytophthora cactorum]|uniref:Uncharacterized protein n=1 Tax=Phytophthora cactorum TaxID=29920 RepID=A0A8T1U687_9STRA|nr:hypothetical protein JG687_00011313 [Phytophthora cactorum]